MKGYRRAMLIGWLVIAASVAVYLLLAFGEWGEGGPSREHRICEQAARNVGLSPSDPDYLYKIGRCMETLERDAGAGGAPTPRRVTA